jgi:hypothetical protein
VAKEKQDHTELGVLGGLARGYPNPRSFMFREICADGKIFQA